MKKLATLLFSLLLLAMSVRAADVVLTWDQAETNTYSKVYWQTNAAITNVVSIPINVTLYTNSVVTTNVLYSFYVTAMYNQTTNTIESAPSNLVRYQRTHTFNKVTPIVYITNAGMTNWVLGSSPTNGILSGTPPNVTYTRTNMASVKDRWSYSSGEVFFGMPVTNYYSIHFFYPNMPPVVDDLIVLGN